LKATYQPRKVLTTTKTKQEQNKTSTSSLPLGKKKKKKPEEVDKLQEKSLKSTLVASTNACSNIKSPIFDCKTSWPVYKKQF